MRRIFYAKPSLEQTLEQKCTFQVFFGEQSRSLAVIRELEGRVLLGIFVFFGRYSGFIGRYYLFIGRYSWCFGRYYFRR